MKTFGVLIKELRGKKNWPQRKLAYELDIDVSVLSKMENENRFPQKRISEIIRTISKLFNISEVELKQTYLSDKIASILVYEENYESILKDSEKKVTFERLRNIKQTEINFENESN